MAAPPPPLPLPSQYGPYGVFVGQTDTAATLLAPGERVGGPPPANRRRVVWLMALLTLLGVGGWYGRENSEQVTALLSQATAMLDNLQQDQRRLTREQAAEAPKVAEPLPLAEREVVATEPPAAPVEPEAPMQAATATTPAPETDTPAEKTPPAERLPAVVADPTDPLQQKALAAGLHPALSRTLLAQLTAEDFRNAAHAVAAALKGEPTTAPFVWPRRREAKRAQFKIRLVEGAPAACRRYVVQVAKDGWETTARPMERCNATQAFKPS